VGRTARAPALTILRGGASPFVTEEQAALAAAASCGFERAEVVTVPGAGHYVHADAPDEFQSQVRRVLAQP
jgi:pimeloyl-ACP methyl ester carboxylesterase